MPYFRLTGGDHAEFEAAFEYDDSVTNVAPIDEVDDARLYRAEWTQNIESIVYAYVELGATILQAIGRAENWELRMRFDDQESPSQFRTYCEENAISFELNRIQDQEQPMASAQYDLTTKQRETLVTALKQGYYEVPQTVSMSDLAEVMEISQQALSKRVHAALENLITNILTVLTFTHPDDEGVKPVSGVRIA
ncbi:helix-turn-helix domain-containing protein [Natronobacterium lacisalsi]|uniref:helix-turn-helix domain-containing protein n=1 Tax=Natronobacterium lacisalsi TaxID=229731 RepID=UPI001EE737FA|nr:bacterio-opsin activator domain-containing protein [Halobiforma lacisalsi]